MAIQIAFLSRHHMISPDISKKNLQQFLTDCRAALITLLDTHSGESLEVLSPDRPPYEQAFMDLAYTFSLKGTILKREVSSSSPAKPPSPVLPNQRAVVIPEGVTFEEYINGLPGDKIYLLHHQLQLLIPPALRRATYIKV